MSSWTVVTTDESSTEQLGRLLGDCVRQPVLMLLQGELGAGKTVLARGVARGLGVAENHPVTSPTFTLMNHYPARLDLYHFDLYRLMSPDELVDIGFDDYAYGQGATLVEWPEKIGHPDIEGLWVTIERLDEQRRQVTFRPTDKISEDLVATFRQAVQNAGFTFAQ